MSAHLKSATRNYVLLFLGSVAFHLAGTWSLPLIDRDEPRFAEASREMMERGDYVVPYFNNHFRFDKPPLTYWAQVASYRVFGDNDFAARFPSVIAAALTALAIFAWGSAIEGEKLGIWAAIIFSLSLQTFIHAKAAVADMWLVLFMTLAFRGGWELLGNGHATGGRRKWWWIFYPALACAFLAKGPIGWIPLLCIPAMKLFDRGATVGKHFHFISGIALMLSLVSLWGVPALVQTNGEFFRVGIMHHVVDRSFNAMEGHGSNSLGLYILLLPFYFVTIFFSFFPWSIKLPRLAARLWKERDRIDNYLIAGAGVTFIVFTLVKTKLPHYTLPAFPLLALLLARMLLAENSAGFLRKCAIATASALFAIALVVPPFIAHIFPAYALFEKSREGLKPEMEFGAVDFMEPSLVWYFRSRAKGFLTPLKKRETPDFMAKPGPRFVVLPSDNAVLLEPPGSGKMFSIHGFNIPKGKNVDLTLLLKSE